MHSENNSQANKYKEQGNLAYKNQQYAKAIGFYSKAIETNPQDFNFYSNRSLCYFNLSNFEECIRDCDRCLKINNSFVKAHKKKASALVNLLKFQDALVSLKNAAQIEKNQATNNEIEEVESYKSNYDRYLAAERENNFSEALSCITHLVNKIPQNKMIKLARVQCLAKVGDTHEANSFLQTIGGNQKNPEFLYLKGIIELYNGDSVKAKNYFTEGIKIDPQNTKCQRALKKAKRCETFKDEGNELIKQNKLKEAEMKYTQALSLDPFNKKLNSIIYSNRALTYMKRGQKIKALEDLNKSLELDPNYIKSLVRRSEILMERQDYSAALSDFAKIQEIDPSINLKTKIQEAKKKEHQAKKKDYYAILGVAKNATDAEIKKAYKAMALKYHPDRNRGKSEVEQEESSKKFKDIVEAHGVLTDAEKKKMYDSGQMQYDGDTGANMNFNGANMNFGGASQNGFQGFEGFEGMGGNGMKFTFKTNGEGMNGMNGMGFDPSQIFQMFQGMQGMGGMGGKGGKSNMGAGFGSNNKNKKSSKSPNKGFGGFGGFGNFGNFGNFGGFGMDQQK